MRDQQTPRFKGDSSRCAPCLLFSSSPSGRNRDSRFLRGWGRSARRGAEEATSEARAAVASRFFASATAGAVSLFANFCLCTWETGVVRRAGTSLPGHNRLLPRLSSAAPPPLSLRPFPTQQSNHNDAISVCLRGPSHARTRKRFFLFAGRDLSRSRASSATHPSPPPAASRTSTSVAVLSSWSAACRGEGAGDTAGEVRLRLFVPCKRQCL